MRIQSGDGSRKEAFFQSVCPCSDAPLVPARGQQVKKLGCELMPIPKAEFKKVEKFKLEIMCPLMCLYVD